MAMHSCSKITSMVTTFSPPLPAFLAVPHPWALGHKPSFFPQSNLVLSRELCCWRKGCFSSNVIRLCAGWSGGSCCWLVARLPWNAWPVSQNPVLCVCLFQSLRSGATVTGNGKAEGKGGWGGEGRREMSVYVPLEILLSPELRSKFP